MAEALLRQSQRRCLRDDLPRGRRRTRASSEEQVQEGEPAQDTAAAEGGQEAGDDTLENIVEDLKRKNAGE